MPHTARAAGAEKYAPEILSKAELGLRNATDMDRNKHRDEKMEITNVPDANQYLTREYRAGWAI